MEVAGSTSVALLVGCWCLFRRMNQEKREKREKKKEIKQTLLRQLVVVFSAFFSTYRVGLAFSSGYLKNVKAVAVEWCYTFFLFSFSCLQLRALALVAVRDTCGPGLKAYSALHVDRERAYVCGCVCVLSGLRGCTVTPVYIYV